MRRYGAPLLLLLTGAAVLRISAFSELYLRYVRAGLRPYLVVSGALLVLLALLMAVLRRAEGSEEHGEDEGDEGDEGAEEHEDGHGHRHGAPRVAALLALPALALLLFPPPALGSYSAEREAEQRAAQGVGAFPALPAGDPVVLGVGEFSSRAVYDSSRSLKGRTVSMTGFATLGDDGTWYVTRLLVSCCAADATTSKVEIRGADAPRSGTWVTVTGTWHPRGELGTDAAWPSALDATGVRKVAQPTDPYEQR
ncbi:TIGR03943 family putative permease subunit [Streptomyces sp. NPDC090106]|uniref:TIGR03943 family putative permease subunit n=1 Tax=Streptomyces sp. NPDC090106 TaxID=3365946 RepID=UPI003822054A